MKAKFSRFVFAAAIAALVVVFGVTPVQAQITFTDFTNTGNLQLNGEAAPANNGNQNVLRLTPAITSCNFDTCDSTPDTHVRGSAFFNSQQTVASGFTSQFTFQISPGPSNCCGDGFAFVIQNQPFTQDGDSLSGGAYALGGSGGAIGYGQAASGDDEGSGIPNSLAIEFDSHTNGWGDPDNHHVAVQSCGTDPNNQFHVDVGSDFNPVIEGPPAYVSCKVGTIASLSNSLLPNGLSDGAQHIVNLSYTPGTLKISVDGTLVLTVEVNLSQQLNLTGGKAYVGFTAANGAATENHDILSWTFQGGSGQTQTVGTGETTFDFGPFQFTAQLDAGQGTRQVTVTPILKSQGDCNALVQPTFPGAKCFVYDNAGGPGVPLAVMFEVTCPDTDASNCSNFLATLGTKYHFTESNNPNYRDPGGNGNPLPGWLKGHPTDTLNPCNKDPDSPLFQSNQIESWVAVDDPTATTKGKSGGTGSCWVATYNTPNMLANFNIVAPVQGKNYQQNQMDASTQASYNCIPKDNSPNATGPYLTEISCSATNSFGPPPTVQSVPKNAQFDTSVLGTHTFVATVLDSATDTTLATDVSKQVTYNVVGPADLAMVKLAPSSIATGKKITYSIGVGNLGPNSAQNVTVKDTLPVGLSLSGVTFSASNVSCSLVNKKIVCTTINKTSGCSIASGTVTCNVGTIVPLSLSPLNGATVQITATVTAGAGTSKKPTVIKNTATVSADNFDPHNNTNSSSASTTVTAH